MGKPRIFSSTLILFLITWIYPGEGGAQQFHFTGTLQCELTQQSIPEAHIKVVDKYTQEVILQYRTNEKGEYDFLCPASERVTLSIESPLFQKRGFTYRELNEWQLSGVENMQLTPLVINSFRYTLALKEPVKNRIHLSIKDMESEELILDYPDAKFPLKLPILFSNDKTYRISILCPGYFSAFYEINRTPSGNVIVKGGIPYDADLIEGKNDPGLSAHEIVHHLRLYPIELNMNIEIQGISYKLGESYIEPAAARVLDRVIEFVASHPEVIFELGSHSNDWKNDLKNQDLSILRANVVVDYLVEKGDISSQRISAKGYGPFQMKKLCPGLESCENIKVLKSHEHSRTFLKVIDIHSTGSSIQGKPEGGPPRYERSEAGERLKIQEIDKAKKQEAQSDQNDHHPQPEKFSGQAIQLLFTSKPLPDSHPLFSYKDLFIDFNRDKGGYAYLVKIGKENNRLMHDLKEFRTTYSDAFVVSYQNGQRVP